MAEINAPQYASSPCMAHELDACGEADDECAHELYIVYLYVVEGGAGYRWQVRGHEMPEPFASSPELFPSASRACEAGRVVLERICDQFDRYARF